MTPQAELTLEIYNKVKRGYEKEISKMELSETLSDRIRNNELDYDEEIDAYSAEEDGIYIQLQDRELDEYQATNNSEKGLQIVDKQPRVSSNTWGRIWKDGKLIKTFKGPRYKVRADMTKYLENYLKDTKFSMNKITEAADNRLSYNSIRYKGYRISLLTDGSGYAIFDKHGEMEDHGFKSIKDAKSAIDEFNSIYKPVLSKGLSEASYGGAFDIEDDMFFTRNDLVDFGEKVCEILGEIYPDTFDISDTYIHDNNILFLEVTSKQGNEGSANFKIDMRKIKKPSDLLRFADEMAFYLRQDLEELYTNNSIFAESKSSEKPGDTFEAIKDAYIGPVDSIYNSKQGNHTSNINRLKRGNFINKDGNIVFPKGTRLNLSEIKEINNMTYGIFIEDSTEAHLMLGVPLSNNFKNIG